MLESAFASNNPNTVAFIAACSTAVPAMLSTIKALKELVEEARGFDHAQGCSGSYLNPDGSWSYNCMCGRREWLETVEEVLEEKNDDTEQGRTRQGPG